VLDPLDVGGPVDAVRVLRAGDDEAEVGAAAGGLEEQAVEGGLSVVAVGAEIAQVPALGGAGVGRVGRGVDGAVERLGPAGAADVFEVVEDLAAGEGEVGVKEGDLAGGQVLLVARVEPLERHGVSMS
jgi:hypothetical protein